MKIVRIFADQLFAFQFNNEKMNELQRLLTLWNDTAHLYKFVTENKSDVPKDLSISSLVFQLSENANEIDDTLNEISSNSERSLEEFFKPLDNQEYHIVELSKQKGRKNYLRLFALRIDINCFVITGGAIKFHHLNKDRPHTQKEMQKIDRCRDYLRNNNVFDNDSFYEFLNEQQ
jgi:cell division protein FtsB